MADAAYDDIPEASPIPRAWVRLALLAGLCVLAYSAALKVPLLEDDYPNLAYAIRFGAPGEAAALFHDSIFRVRATGVWAMYLLWRAFGLSALGYHAASILLHVLNVCLLFLLARSWPRMRPAAFWAAAFFAVHEGHQEAIFWFSAVNELLMFAFGIGSLLCWRAARDGKWRWPYHAAGVALFILALLSKESALILLPLFLLTIPLCEWRRSAAGLLPYAVPAAVIMLSIFQTSSYSFRFSDGSFSLGAPFWITLPRSLGRLLFPWGWAAAGAILLAGDRSTKRSAAVTFSWMATALIPYSFLTYMTAIPSRQTYLAGAGTALLAGLAAARLWSRFPARRRVIAALAVVMILHNVVYLWTRKRAQFQLRAEPTEQLVALARRTKGPIFVRSFPRPPIVAEEAVRLATGRPASDLVWNESEARRRGAAVEFSFIEK